MFIASYIPDLEQKKEANRSEGRQTPNKSLFCETKEPGEGSLARQKMWGQSVFYYAAEKKLCPPISASKG